MSVDPDTIYQKGLSVSRWRSATTKRMGQAPTTKLLPAKTHKSFGCANGRFLALTVVEH
ncbi:MAG: hypothetical protein HP494_14545 [Nitrospira sp.]|nr:hypothetical protein [Nitrospira sp.]